MNRTSKQLKLFWVAVFAFALLISCGKKSEPTHTLVLKDGTVLKGELVGRNDAGFKFQVNGETREIPIGQVYSLTMKEGEQPIYTATAGTAVATETPAVSEPAKSEPATEEKTTPATAAKSETAPTAKSTPPPAPKPVTVASGTRMMLKLSSGIGTATHQTGSGFTSTLDADLAAGGVVVAPKGTTVYGKVLESSGGKRVGTQRIVATFTEISINDQKVAIVTDDVGAEGGRGGAARKVGAGALIGAAAGDAGTGALVGAGVALLGKGGEINIPAGTLVEVTLKQPFTVMK
jgi:hypothetical protein